MSGPQCASRLCNLFPSLVAKLHLLWHSDLGSDCYEKSYVTTGLWRTLSLPLRVTAFKLAFYLHLLHV